MEEFKIVAYCWTCAQLLYAAEKDDQITARVSYDAQSSHWDSFTEDHEIVEYPDLVM